MGVYEWVNKMKSKKNEDDSKKRIVRRKSVGKRGSGDEGTTRTRGKSKGSGSHSGKKKKTKDSDADNNRILNFELLDDEALNRYRLVHRLRVRPAASKNELLAAIEKHHKQLEVDERPVLDHFLGKM